jgi:small subunit ribosomal protein S20
MPIIKSAKKRVRTAEKAAIRNSKTKRSLRTALKDLHKAVTSSTSKTDKDVVAKHSEAQSNLDKAVKKGILHRNKAARLKRQAAAQAKTAGTAPVKKTTAKKKTAAAKKPAAKKAPAKKAAK